VLQADRSLIDKRYANEPTGEVQSIMGHLGGMRMGDKFERTAPEGIERRRVKRAKLDQRKQERASSRMLGGEMVVFDCPDRILSLSEAYSIGVIFNLI
jgi:hypothetical protein